MVVVASYMIKVKVCHTGRALILCRFTFLTYSPRTVLTAYNVDSSDPAWFVPYDFQSAVFPMVMAPQDVRLLPLHGSISSYR